MRLRSANRGNANNTWNVNSNGNVNNNNAYNANRGCPDCSAWATRLACSVGTPKKLKDTGSRMPSRKGKQHFGDAAILLKRYCPLLLRGFFMRNFDESLEFEALYESMWKCKRGKMWKASVAGFVCHGIERTLQLEKELKTGTYLPRKPHTFQLTYPKLRPCSSTHIRDRIVQRSLNDNVIYPAMTRGFIWDNMACQKGKGTTLAMDRLDVFLHRYFINNGSNTGFVLQADVHGYYRNMRHVDARSCFRRRLDEKTVDASMKWLQRQYPTDIGYEPGSQMVQILGISLLDPMDHAAKEKVRAKLYERYMDDFFIISNDYGFLEQCRDLFSEQLALLGMELHPDKTRIYPLKDGIPFLGFSFRLTETGKVIRIISPKNVKHERKKLLKMANMVKKGEMTKEKFFSCYGAWKAHALKGNSYKLLQRMDQYVKSLMEGITDGNYPADSTDCRTSH